MGSEPGEVERQYARGKILGSILDSLRESGKDVASLSPVDLAAVDEFHIRGREATIELAERAEIGAGARVLDVGCGLGGSARYLAEQGATVTGIDLTQEYVEVATALSSLVRLESQTRFLRADATRLPFEDAEFDFVWTEHVQMNIEQKEKFYGEITRVLRPGGKFLFHDVFAGGGGDVHFPVPWARNPRVSHLVGPEEMRRLLSTLGFKILTIEDRSADSIAWFRRMLARVRENGFPRLGLHLLLGDDAEVRFENILRNLEDKRIVVVQGVAQK
ncbi:MAG: class I SAM-dependent methyltransferase [Fimbriimonadaceae bacterium]|nr:class I SAM-dependent methyltransferase [Fimbriimonadaceae bacterium]